MRRWMTGWLGLVELAGHELGERESEQRKKKRKQRLGRGAGGGSGWLGVARWLRTVKRREQTVKKESRQ